MNQQELLAALRDIHEPAPPPAPSTALALLSIALVCVSFLLIMIMWRHRRQQPERALLQRLEAARRAAPERTLTLLSGELRTLVAARHGEAALSVEGDDWLALLDATFDTTLFTRGDGRLFGDVRYRPMQLNKPDTDALIEQLQPLMHRAVRQRIPLLSGCR